MAKKNYKEIVKEDKEMTLEEAKSWRASLASPVKKLTEKEKRNAFRIFWTQEKRKYIKAQNLEEVLWIHLKSMKMDNPGQFEEGLKHFGLKRVK